MKWSDETVEMVAQQFCNHVQDCCYTNELGVVDGVMGGEDYLKAANAALAAVAQSKELQAHRSDTSAKVDVEWVLQKFIQRADSEYCKGIHMATYDDDTRGWEARAKAGRYGEAEHKAHEKLNKHMGAHYTIYDVVKEVRASLQAHRSDTSAVKLVRELVGKLEDAFASTKLPTPMGYMPSSLSNAILKTITKAEQWLKKVGA